MPQSLEPTSRPPRRVSLTRPVTRLAVSLLFGLAIGILTGVAGPARFAPVVGWTLTAGIFTLWTWVDVFSMDAVQTATHATREEPTRRVTHLLLVAAAVTSLVGVTYLIISNRYESAERLLAAATAVISVVTSWLMIHTLFGLGYARFYYTGDDGGINFNQQASPRYTDFMYVAFTVGVSYAISDTNVEDSDLRATVLGHALLSYLFGSVFIAATINLLVGL